MSEILVIHLLRKPLSESTVAENVLRWGTGGLNIDATRLATTEDLNGGAYAPEGTDRYDGYENWRFKRQGGAGEYEQPKGRWPSNVILEHDPGCRIVGEKTIPGNPTSKSFHAAYEGESPTGLLRGWSHPGNQHGGPDGTETIPDWACVDGCPCADLDGQSGFSRSAPGGIAGWQTAYVGGKPGTAVPRKGQTDSGGASRYFKQIKGL